MLFVEIVFEKQKYRFFGQKILQATTMIFSGNIKNN